MSLNILLFFFDVTPKKKILNMVDSRCSRGSGSVYVVAVVYDDGSEDDGGDDGNGGEGDGDDVICEVGVEDGSGGRVGIIDFKLFEGFYQHIPTSIDVIS